MGLAADTTILVMLLAALLIAVWIVLNQNPRPAGQGGGAAGPGILHWLGRFEDTLCPDFGDEYFDADLRRVFKLLLRVVYILALAVIAWSIAAGVLSAGRWVSGNLTAPQLTATRWSGYPVALLFVAGSVVLAIKMIGIMSLLTMAAGLTGGFLGYLFGLPSRDSRPAPTGGGQPPAGAAAHTPAESHVQAPADSHGQAGNGGWALNANLMQITDWLTKTIVGVSLVEARGIYSHFASICETASQHLLDGAFGSDVAVPAAIVGGGILGFKLCNIYTQLFLTRLIAQVEPIMELARRKWTGAMLELTGKQPDPGVIAAPIQLTKPARDHATPGQQQVAPTPAQVDASAVMSRYALANLSTADAVLAWARGRAIANDYTGAAEGYRKLISLSRLPDPVVLAEAARVYAQTGRLDDARQALTDALSGVGRDMPVLRVPIVRDLVVLLLYDPKPGGYTRSLSILNDPPVVDADPTGELALLRACANGQKFKYETDNRTLQNAAELKEMVLGDVRTALKRGQSPEWIWYLANADAKDKPPPDSPEREDDLEPFQTDIENLDEIKPLVTPPAAATPNQTNPNTPPPTPPPGR